MQKSGVTRIFLFNYFSIRDILISFLACAPLLTINFERACMVRVETRIQSIYYIMLYSEGSGTRKVGFYGTYPRIKTKNGFAVFGMMIFVPEKKKEILVYFGTFDDYVKIRARTIVKYDRIVDTLSQFNVGYRILSVG